MSVTHSKVTAVPDDPDFDVGSNEWNDEHVVDLDATDVGADAAGTAAAAVTAHEGASDPHPTYETSVEAAAKVSAHAAASDPHTEYLKESDFTGIDIFVGTATGVTSSEIVAGTSPGGELGGTWASPTVDATHSGSTHSDATDTHIADTSAAHAASAIGFTPNGSISSTDVQAAIQEVRDEAAGGGAPSTVNYLVGTADGGLSAEIVVGTAPGGEFGGTWASPTVDATHSGSTHGAAVTTHEAASDPHTGYRLESADHSHASTGLQGGVIAASVITADSTTLVGTGANVQAVFEEMDDDIAALKAVDYLVGTATSALSGEIAVGTTPGGELGGTWASPTVDSTHSGSTHAAATTTHEAASDPHTGYMLESVFGSTSAALLATLQAVAGGIPKIIRSSGDTTVNNSTTLVDVNGLNFAIAVNEVWFVEVFLISTMLSVTADLKFGWTAPTGATADWGALQAGAGTQPGFGIWPVATSATAMLTISQTMSIGSLASRIGVSMGGIFTADATHAGTIQLQFAQNTQTAENSIIRQLNSFLRIQRLG